MRLLRVIASMDPVNGGPCQGIRNSTPALRALGCSSEVVCLDSPSAGFLGSDSFPVHPIGKGRGYWCYHSDLDRWLSSKLPEFDAAILHGLWLYPGFALSRAARRTKIPYFVFPHGMLDPWFQRDPSRKIKAFRNWVYWKSIEHRVIRDAAGLLFTCEEERRLAGQTFRPYQPKREITAGYGIPEPPVENESQQKAFRKRCLGLEPNRPYLLFLSRIHPKKAVDLLIRAYARISKELARDGKVCPALVVAGPGLDTSYGREMAALAAAICRPETVFFTGMLQGDEKWGALHGCEAFVLPSHQENFGISVVEALACHKPVLISDKVNIWREIKNENAGCIAADDLDAVDGLLQYWVLLDSGERDRMTESARRCFEKYFEVSKAAANLENIVRAYRYESRQ